MPDVPNNREGLQARETSKCLNGQSYGDTLCERLGWMMHKLESRLPSEISITSDMQMTPPLWQKAKKN